MTPLVRRYIKTSFTFLLLGALLGGYIVVAEFLVGTYPSRLLITAHVHLLLVGFLPMIVMGVATWMFPRPGKEPRPEARHRGYIELGCGTPVAPRSVRWTCRADVVVMGCSHTETRGDWIMRARTVLMTALALGASLIQVNPALAQGATISDAECQVLRQRLAEHAKLSEGVRRAVAVQAGAAPAGATPSAPAGRAEAIRARLEQIPKDRQALDEQRLGAMMRFELSRAGQLQLQIQALDVEKATLEKELAALPASPSTQAAAPPQAPAADATTRIRCQDIPVAVDNALKIRRRELGAREDQAGAIPLVGLKGQTADQVGQELAGQFASWPGASIQVGLLDADGNGQVDGFVDVPAPGVFRLVRQRADGTISIAVFQAASGATSPYGEPTRRLDETTLRQTGQALPDLLATRPAGPLRAVTQTGEFDQAYAQFQAGNFADASRLGAAAARSGEFQNLRGQSVRVLEVISPVTGGVSLRRTVVLAQPNDQELWEETTTIVRPTSFLRTDVEVARSRATRSVSGALVGTPSVSAPSKFSLER